MTSRWFDEIREPGHANEAGEALSLGNGGTDGTISDVHVIRKLRVASGEQRIEEKVDPSPPFATIFMPACRRRRDWVRDDKAPTP